MKLIKGHGLGNDYLVVHNSSHELTPDQVRLLCDRHTGLGGDGILEPRPTTAADFGLRIWNPDGSTAEKSGNGLRIFARYLVEHRGADRDLTIEVEGGRVRCLVTDDDVTVQMGSATFEPDEVPAREELWNSPHDIDGRRLHLNAVGIGNPHCVCFVDEELDGLDWRRWGATLERSPLFPNRANVQFARVIDAHNVEIRIWERGAGPTRASGSSSCAVAAAAVAHGHCASPVTVHMPGGTLTIGIDAAFGVTMTGPAELVAWMEPLGELAHIAP